MTDTPAPAPAATLTLDQIFQQAITHHQAGQLPEAERRYRAILQAQPQHGDANHNLGILAVSLGQAAGGLPYLTAALETNRVHRQYWLSYLDVLAKLGRGAEARVSQAVMHREFGRYKDSAEVLQAWLAEHPQDAGAHALLAYALSLGQQESAAWQALDAALTLDATLPVVRLTHARLLLRQGKVEESLRAALAAHQSRPGDAEAQLVLATAWMAAKQDQHARPLLDGALQARPNYAEALGQRAVLKQRNGDFVGARQDAEQAVALKPHLTPLWGVVGALRHHFKDLQGAIQALEKALEGEPAAIDHLLSLGEFKQQAGQLDSAVAVLQQATEHHPTHVAAWTHLGNALHQMGRKGDARAAYTKALALAPRQAEVLSNLGFMATNEGQLDEAMAYLEQALALQPDNPVFMANHFAVLQALERHDDAEALARRMVQVAPAYVTGHLALASVLTAQKRYVEAQATLDLLPRSGAMDAKDLQQLGLSYGNLFGAQQRWGEVEAWMRRVLQATPDDRQALNMLANCLLSQGQAIDEALDIMLRSLTLEESDEAKRLFIVCVKTLPSFRANESLRQFLTHAIEQPWEMPTTCAAPSIALLKETPGLRDCIARASQAWPKRLGAQDLFGADALAALAGDRLLHAVLVTMPVCSLELECCLTMARQVMLQAVMPGEPAPAIDMAGALGFWCALARQCFVNEYVFSPTDAELLAATDLRALLVDALERGADIPQLWPVAVAAYFPLMSLAHAQRLLQRSWPDEVMAVLVQQVAEPLAERQLRQSIPCLTPIEDQVSLLVQSQYEENPYPRWVSIAATGKPKRVGAELLRLFPLSGFQPSDMFNNPEVLIAGCGTGQHSILTAQRFQAARVLAVDLSMSSLSYAKRKTGELGLSHVTYAQADLLRLGALDQRFDVIESVGVLHHMDDPWLGWRTLLSVLRPKGVMRLGFYSEAARSGVVRGRARIAERAYPPTPEGVRQCRQDLIQLDKGDSFGGVMTTIDFYSVSACRDLLFNIQEHRMTLDSIAAFLREHDLSFLGFELNPVVVAAYRQRFPEDPAATDLGRWQAYERENPDTFFGMYQFWVQKNS